jgi:hypothetical protein
MGFELTKNCIKMLKWAPLLYLLNAYWILSNKQIFHGWVFPRMQSDEQMMSGHNFITTLTLNQTTPILVIAITCVTIFILMRYFKPSMVRFGFSIKNPELDVIEELPSFYDCIRDNNWLVSESQYYWNKYALRLIPTTLHRRLAINKAKKQMTGGCWYNILANEDYV